MVIQHHKLIHYTYIYYRSSFQLCQSISDEDAELMRIIVAEEHVLVLILSF